MQLELGFHAIIAQWCDFEVFSQCLSLTTGMYSQLKVSPLKATYFITYFIIAQCNYYRSDLI